MSATGRPTLAMYGAASCGGCEIAVLNTHEAVLAVDAAFEVVFWPVVMDASYADVEKLPDQSIDLTLFNGGIRQEHNVHLAQVLRRKSKLLVAFGSCAGAGGIPGLANLVSVRQLFDTVYETLSTENPDHVRPTADTALPGGTIHLPPFEPVLRALDQVVPVDYWIPGCPPEPKQITAVLELVIAALAGKAELPPRGSVIGAGDSTVCDECARQRDVKKIAAFTRLQELKTIDATVCLLEQGIPCSGSGTRSGCGAMCPSAGAPCIGCYGAADNVVDQGAKLLSAYASVIAASTPDEIDRVLDGLPDPVGQFYRFGLARSLLRSGKSAWDGDGHGEARPLVGAAAEERR